MKRFIFCSLLWLLIAGITACNTDDLPDVGREFGEGECEVTGVLEFSPLVPALNGRTRTLGNAIEGISSLCVLLYDEQGSLVRKYAVDEYDGGTDSSAGKRTSHAEFKLTVPFGRYYIFAVVNMGQLESHDGAIRTVEGLRNIALQWNGDDVAANGQMFGHFDAAGTSSSTAPLLDINRKSISLQAKVRRAASKVTIAYDGSRLAEGVFVYIRSVQIRDIPSACLLGAESAVTEESVTAGTNSLLDGETLIYGPPEGDPVYDENWKARVTRGSPYYPQDPNDDTRIAAAAHSETAPALFFYENMQGKGRDKKQDKDHLGENAIEKDDKPYGTYIEVTGYYRSINAKRLGSGPIVFRFMLGKDIATDYDAERNHHYKLTLTFNRFANDADWHIDYEEQTPQIILPDVYYISYLYNHSMEMPVKINAAGHELVSFEAHIDANSWAPYDAPNLDYRRDRDPNVTAGAPLNPWNGFLSLRKTKESVLNDNKNYYEQHKRGDRSYYAQGVPVDQNSESDGGFTVERDEKSGEYRFGIPMWTRAKTLGSGFTGNNPYVAYRRKAVVTFTARLKNIYTQETTTLQESVDVMQVRRVVNPKGIWRRNDSTKPFHVVLKHLPYESATRFETFSSEGPWRAYVVAGDRTLVKFNDGEDEARGSTGSPIDFMVDINGTCEADESRCAIIRVEYHNYSCQHLIFVRQGDAPMQLLSGECKWHARNLFTGTRETNSPVEEGSLFRCNNLTSPIDATSNELDWAYGTPVTAGSFLNHANTPLRIAGTTGYSLWANIEAGTTPSFPEKLTVDGREVRVAAYADFNALGEDPNIEQGFGVLYGDDAGETLDDVSQAYGHRYDQQAQGYGMRGVFIYNSTLTGEFSGRNLFFPLGASGFGRRQDHCRDSDYPNVPQVAVLRYANRATTFPFGRGSDMPLFHDLYMRPGAIYWLSKAASDGTTNVAGWDFNYFTLEVKGIHQSNLFGASDACFIRCVED